MTAGNMTDDVSEELQYINKVFAIICVSVTPLIILLIFFNFIVLYVSKQRSVDLVTCTLLLGRLGHSGAVVLFLVIYTLEHWIWSKSMCHTFIWLWVTFWTLDLFTGITFLSYHSMKVGKKKTNIRFHMLLLICLSWGLSVLAGALTFLLDWLFHNYANGGLFCAVGLSTGDTPIQVGSLLIIIVGGLLIIVLTITLSAESRAQAMKYKLRYPETVREVPYDKVNGVMNPTASTTNPDEVFAVIEVSREGQNSMKSNGNNTKAQVNGDTVRDNDIQDNSNNSNNIGSSETEHQRSDSAHNVDTPQGSNLGSPNLQNTEHFCHYNEAINSHNQNNNSNQSGSEPTHSWRYVDTQMRDTRHIYGATTASTLILNLAPQLVLYAMNAVSGTTYLYTHHILVGFGILHSLVLPVTLCTTGLRYKETSKRLIRNAFGAKYQPKPGESKDPEGNLVFHIRDVTLTESNDISTPTENEIANTSEVKSQNQTSNNYHRSQLQVLSMRNEPSLAPSTSEKRISEEPQTGTPRQNSADSGNSTVVAAEISLVSAVRTSGQEGSKDTLKGVVNPGYEDFDKETNGDDSRPAYDRSHSDGVVDYREQDMGDSESDWGSYDSDSETWSNLYDESDISDVLDDHASDSHAPHRLSPSVRNRRRSSPHHSPTGSKGHRRRRSSQQSLPVHGNSPKHERRRSEDKRKHKHRKKRGKDRRGSRDLAAGLATTMNLGIASTIMTRDPKAKYPEKYLNGAQKDNTDESTNTLSSDEIDRNMKNEHLNTGGTPPPPPPPAPPLPTAFNNKSPNQDYLTIDSEKLEIVSEAESDRVETQSEFASELAAAATKLRKTPGKNQSKTVLRKESSLHKSSGKPKHDPSILRKESSRKSVNNMPVIPLRYKAEARKQSRKDSLNRTMPQAIVVNNDNNPTSRRSSSRLTRVEQDSVIERKQSLKRVTLLSPTKTIIQQTQRRSAPPGVDISKSKQSQDAGQLRPLSLAKIDPMIADMPLSKIMTNPFLSDMLRQSLESLNSIDDEKTESSKQDDKIELETFIPPPREFKQPLTVATTSINRKSHYVNEGFQTDGTDTKSKLKPQNPFIQMMSKSSSSPAEPYKPKTLYTIPTIDADHRYRPRKPLRRGKAGFKQVAQMICVSEFIKKSVMNVHGPPTAEKPSVPSTKPPSKQSSLESEEAKLMHV